MDPFKIGPRDLAAINEDQQVCLHTPTLRDIHTYVACLLTHIHIHTTHTDTGKCCPATGVGGAFLFVVCPLHTSRPGDCVVLHHAAAAGVCVRVCGCMNMGGGELSCIFRAYTHTHAHALAELYTIHPLFRRLLFLIHSFIHTHTHTRIHTHLKNRSSAPTSLRTCRLSLGFRSS